MFADSKKCVNECMVRGDGNELLLVIVKYHVQDFLGTNVELFMRFSNVGIPSLILFGKPLFEWIIRKVTRDLRFFASLVTGRYAVLFADVLYDRGPETRPEETLERDLIGLDRPTHGATIQLLRERDTVRKLSPPRPVGVSRLLYAKLGELWIGPPQEFSIAIQSCPAYPFLCGILVHRDVMVSLPMPPEKDDLVLRPWRRADIEPFNLPSELDPTIAAVVLEPETRRYGSTLFRFRIVLEEESTYCSIASCAHGSRGPERDTVFQVALSAQLTDVVYFSDSEDRSMIDLVRRTGRNLSEPPMTLGRHNCNGNHEVGRR